MTQQDIVDELNRMVIGYNIHWNMVKFDADKAIMKINSYLGANYPMMSEVLLSPQHRYTVKYKNIDLPIFPERYILTVVIPYIATEVLARDEEFTTIYNKYAMDVENGLFDMFQNEFNRIPKVFRQDPDVGVYFSKDVPHHKIREDFDKRLPEITYNVYYHFNFDDYPLTEPFTIDVNKYPYGSTVELLQPTVTEFIKDLYYYRFEGWMLNPDDTIGYEPGNDTLVNNITSDVHIYAHWGRYAILKNTNGVISFATDFTFDPNFKIAPKVIELDIPVFVDHERVSVIPQNFTNDAINLVSVKLPRTDLTIQTNAFTAPSLQQLILPTYDYLRDYPKSVVLEKACIRNTNIHYLYIPYSVTEIQSRAIQGVFTHNNQEDPIYKIQCEIEHKPDAWADDWTTTESDDIDWGVMAHG